MTSRNLSTMELGMLVAIYAHKMLDSISCIIDMSSLYKGCVF